ncbi:MAG: hypothetical protein IKR19_07510 [Acholeplasmatales bacterium]|nr:hypothetical protein [Acholeplasmatales bacterium]
MLGLNTISVEFKKIKYPVYFEHRNVCIHCGAEGTLVFLDRFGREYDKELEVFEHIKCTRCKRIYSIRWDKSPLDGTMKPSAVDFGIATQFNNFINRDATKNCCRNLQ